MAITTWQTSSSCMVAEAAASNWRGISLQLRPSSLCPDPLGCAEERSIMAAVC
jgi:hypothetical protein